MHLRMQLEPGVPFGLVSVEIIENHVDFPARVLGHGPVHEIEKLASPPPRVVSCFHLAGDHVKRGKPSRCSVSLVTVAEAIHGLAVG